MNEIETTWQKLKDFISQRAVVIQFIEFEDSYLVYADDDFIKLSHYLIKNPSDNTDLLDFETNYKPTANKPKIPKDSDGASLNRTKITKQGWTQFNCFLEIQTSFIGVKWSKDKAGNDGWLSVKCYKLVSGSYVECSDQTDATANCVRTVADWEPTCDYEIIGGEIRTLDRPTDDCRIKVIAVPDIPQNFGGTKFMGSGVNLKFYNSREPVLADGRTVKMLTYSNIYHTNKIRFEVDHALGASIDILIKMESYVA
jgi:hypothetical protein